jgi:hypothetical protein
MNSCYEEWKKRIPIGKPFRVSACLVNGKYVYQNFTKPQQFRNWLKHNYWKIHTIVGIR